MAALRIRVASVAVVIFAVLSLIRSPIGDHVGTSQIATPAIATTRNPMVATETTTGDEDEKEIMGPYPGSAGGRAALSGGVAQQEVSASVAALLDALSHDPLLQEQGVGNTQSSRQDTIAFCERQRQRAWSLLLARGSPELIRRLEAHRLLHERAARGEAPPGQKYLVWSLSGGLGNRFLSLSSTFVAAVLSGRVLLMKSWFTPLPPSTIKQTPVILPSARTKEYFLEDRSRLFWNATGRKPYRGWTERRGAWNRTDELLCPLFPMMAMEDFGRLYPDAFDEAHREDHVKVDIAARHDKSLKRWERFLCAELNATTTRTTTTSGAGPAVPFFPERFVYVWANQFYLPALYANPHHGPELQRMFPNGKPYEELLGLLAIPSLPVMRMVKRFFAKSPARVPHGYDALHVRAFEPKQIRPIARRFATCHRRRSSSSSPMTATTPGGGGSWDRNPRSGGRAPPSSTTGGGVFLATMHGEVQRYFHSHYGSSSMGGIWTNSEAEGQVTGDAGHDQTAFADMLLLALGRNLYVSPGSTFGMFVAAFAQRRPTVVQDDGTCTPARSLEPCFGSWYQRDHLHRRATTGGRDGAGELACRVLPVPADVFSC